MQNITEPTLLLDEEICKANINRMAEKARSHRLKLKPHMKTHQSEKIGEWLRSAGVEAITVSSVKMANYFCDRGWDDITIAFPCNLRQIDRINKLAESVSLTLLVNSLQTARVLEEKLTNRVKAYIEIDTGSHRTGLETNQIPKIKRLIDEISTTTKIEWIGFYSHPGHSYSSRSKKEIKQIHKSVINQFKTLRSKLQPTTGKFEVCIGDTPCCSVATEFGGIDAVSPGNFVFFDLMQHQIGSCSLSDIAVAMFCPIVDKFADRNELIIHGGAIHFSKESMVEKKITHYGKIAIREDNHWKLADNTSYLNRLSQEHGVIECSKGTLSKYKIGDLITVLPVHSCLTANLMKSYLLDNGNTIKQF